MPTSESVSAPTHPESARPCQSTVGARQPPRMGVCRACARTSKCGNHADAEGEQDVVAQDESEQRGDAHDAVHDRMKEGLMGSRNDGVLRGERRSLR